MKFIHTSDLHIGKIVNGFPMLEDQRAVLAQVVQCAREEQADAVFLCGDIYDRSRGPGGCGAGLRLVSDVACGSGA